MKDFLEIAFDTKACRRELDRLRTLLDTRQELSERQDIVPLFKDCPQMAAFIGTTFSGIGPANRIAYEMPIFGNFAADIVIGNHERKTYCAIELEDARPNSVFNRVDSRATTEWGRRLEHGFGQLVDWFFAFDDQKNTHTFQRTFGPGHVEFFGMLIIGRARDISESDVARLRWRSDRVTVNTHKVYCLTYDALYAALDRDWRLATDANLSRPRRRKKK